MGRGLSMGIQYLQETRSDSTVKGWSKIPNCMQLIFELSFSSLLLNELPSNLQFPSWTRFKTLGVMEDKVTSRVCNLMLNIMQASLLWVIACEWIHPHIATNLTHLEWWCQMNHRLFKLITCKKLQLKVAQNSDQLTILVIYDGLCCLCYTTNFLKDGCLACICPPNDKDAKMLA